MRVKHTVFYSTSNIGIMTKSQPFPILLVIKPFHSYFNYHYNSVFVNTNLTRSAAVKSDRFKFNFDDDKEENSVNKKRVWWSDNSNNNKNVYSMDFEDDDDEGLGFGVLEDSFDTSWIFKVLNAFGWMVPAIAISMLLGTGGTNTFVMALVLPIAQSVISFVTDTLWGDPVSSTKRKHRAKKKPFRRAQNGAGMKQDTDTKKVNENYQFRNATKGKPHAKRASSFGGWDDLDQELRSYKPPRSEPTRMENELGLGKKGKLSRRVKSRGTPLLVRLLIAVFPFLGSWTRLL